MKKMEESNPKGKVIPLFPDLKLKENTLPIQEGFADGGDDMSINLIREVLEESHADESPTLYELTEHYLESAETMMTREGQVVVVPIDDMDACVEEIMDASARLAAYEACLEKISNRPNEMSAKIARDVLKKHKWTP